MLSVKVCLTSYLIPPLLLSIISPRTPSLIYDFTLLWEGQEELGFTSPSWTIQVQNSSFCLLYCAMFNYMHLIFFGPH